MNKILLIIFSFCILNISSGQIVLTLQVPQAGVLLKPQLWSGIITNSYPATKQIYLGVTLSDAMTGELVLTGLTSRINAANGVVQLDASTLSPVTYDYLLPDITDRNPEGFLPAGNYSVCYTVFVVDENNGTPVSEQCTPVNIEPVSPPMLNIPFDNQVIHNSYPQFSWIPPTPFEIFSNLNYDFTVVEVQHGQSSQDAVQQNLPVYTTNTNDVFLNYPASYPALDTGKTYAWQITAKNNSQYAAQSDVWTFSISDTAFKTKATELDQYTKLRSTLDASISASINTLHAYYENDAGDSIVQYIIYDIDQNSDNTNGLRVIDSSQLKLTSGINLITLPLDKLPGIGDGKQYLFQLYNSRQETWSMKFIYYKKD